MKFRRIAMPLATLLVASSSDTTRAEFIINEVLANEPGSATTLEWVELINWPDTGSGVVTLRGYRFIEGGDTTRLDTALSVPPGGFVVLARRTFGANSFESRWGNNSGVWGDVPEESYPVITVAKMSLRNSGDTVLLISPTGSRSTMFWRSDAGDGISVERVRPDRGDNYSNFAFCVDPMGSTPARTNSVFPVRGDLALDSVWVEAPRPAWGEPLTISASVANVGFGAVSDAVVETFAVALPETVGADTIPIHSWTTGLFAEGDTRLFSTAWNAAPPGPLRIVARIRRDANPTNNRAEDSLTVRHTRPLIVISEFMAAPEPGGPDEWMEISNQAGFPINLTGTSVGDSAYVEPLPDGVGLMPAGAFWVLAESAVNFRSFYQGFDGVLHEVRGWRELNDTGDRIRFVGAAGEVIDSVSYRSVFGQNHSTERVELKPAFAAPRDWAMSKDPSGATPGRLNSVVRGQAGEIVIDSLWIPAAVPVWGQTLEVHAAVSNVGYGTVRDARIRLSRDQNLSSPGSDLETIQAWSVDSVGEGEVRQLEYEWSGAPPGINRLVAQVEGRDSGSALSAAAVVVIRFAPEMLIISEYLAGPAAGGPGEWIEIANVSRVPVPAQGIRIGDSTGLAVLPPYVGTMPPDAFWILAESEAAFRSFYAGFSGTVWEVSGWRELNNSGDRVRLAGPGGEIIDSVSYRHTYGNNHSSERVELSMSPASPDDWAESVDPSGATPGRANSVDRSAAGPLEVSVSPNPVYRARDQAAQISYRVEIGEHLTLKIFDREGRLVRTLADDRPAASGVAIWDGTDDGGRDVRYGPYVLLARSEPSGRVRKTVIVVGP